ncbi:MAG: EAL domain-containing protein [Alteromonadaceae bacterium]|nr:EAL domain-containing protein [Alteromonadaceae bacterium]
MSLMLKKLSGLLTVLLLSFVFLGLAVISNNIFSVINSTELTLSLLETSLSSQFIFNNFIGIVFIGVVFILALYNLVLYFAQKNKNHKSNQNNKSDQIYLVYVTYILSLFFTLASENNFSPFLISTELQQWLNDFAISFHYSQTALLLLFTLFFLQYDTLKGKIYYLGLSVTTVLFLLGLTPLVTGVLATDILATDSFSLTSAVQTKVFSASQSLIYLFVLYLVGKRLKTDFSWSKFYFISLFPLLISVAIQTLITFDAVENSLLNQNYVLFAVLVQISFMAFALAERLSRNEQDSLVTSDDEATYDQATKIPHKLCFETAIENLIIEVKNKQTAKFSVLVIKPEQIEQIALYMNDEMTVDFYKRLYAQLNALLIDNHKIVDLTNKNEKICFIEGQSLAIIVNSESNNTKQQQSIAHSLEKLIQSIQQTFTQAYQINDLKLPLTSVVGIANYPEHGETSQSLIKHAQLASNNAEKTHQKWAYFEKEFYEKPDYLLKLASDIKLALTNNEFELFHQPQIDLKTLKVCGSECLLRWKHTTEGFISPAVFIPVAEDTGMINQLTLWVIKQALTQHLEIIENGHKNHMISINISDKDIASDMFFIEVVNLVTEAEVSPEKIIFEITEPETINNNEQAMKVLEQLHEFGITISIDHFGSGTSSMSTINQLPFQEMKIDRQFVENVCESVKRKVIAETTIKMGKGLGLELVAEGINSKLDEDTFRKFGCDIGQGYFYSEAIPLSEYLTWLEQEVNGQTPQKDYGEFIPADKSKL